MDSDIEEILAETEITVSKRSSGQHLSAAVDTTAIRKLLKDEESLRVQLWYADSNIIEKARAWFNRRLAKNKAYYPKMSQVMGRSIERLSAGVQRLQDLEGSISGCMKELMDYRLDVIDGEYEAHKLTQVSEGARVDYLAKMGRLDAALRGDVDVETRIRLKKALAKLEDGYMRSTVDWVKGSTEEHLRREQQANLRDSAHFVFVLHALTAKYLKVAGIYEEHSRVLQKIIDVGPEALAEISELSDAHADISSKVRQYKAVADQLNHFVSRALGPGEASRIAYGNHR